MIAGGSTLSIGGLASGLDTGRIVEQLMQVESRGRVRLEWEQALWSTRRDSWRSIMTAASELETASRRLAEAATWGDAARASEAIEGWVREYNELHDRLVSELSVDRPARAETRAQYLTGPLDSDSRVYGMLMAMRGLAGGSVTNASSPVDALADLGITTASRGAAASELGSGRLVIDQARLDEVLASQLGFAREVFATEATGSDRGLARRMVDLTSGWRQGGVIDAALQGAGEAVRALQTRLDQVDERLERRRQHYEQMFARLERTLGRLQSQQQYIAGQLGALAAPA